MKNRFFILAILTLALSNSASAQSCQSIFSSLQSAFNTIVQDFVHFRTQAAEDLVETISTSNISVGEWISVDMNHEFDETFDAAERLQMDLYRATNVILGQGCSHIGAVTLMCPTKKYACSSLFTERTFIIPNHPYDKVEIRVKKTDGKRGIKIKACSKYASNNSIYESKDSKIIESGNDTKGQERVFTFLNQDDDKYITLHLVAHGALPTDKAEYEVKIIGYFNKNKMEELAR